MATGTVITFPNESHLEQILAAETIDIVSPFYSRWALKKFTRGRHSNIRLVTRLPGSFLAPPPVLDNDPEPLLETMSRMGDALTIYSLPHVHAKLYINEKGGWFGSANFTRNGFSGLGEMIVHCAPRPEDLTAAFEAFLAPSTRVSYKNISFLTDSVRSGLTKIKAQTLDGESTAEMSASDAASYDDFGQWISQRRSAIAKYLDQRMHNKYRMSGHAYSGFYGTFSFLTKNPDIGHALLNQGALPLPNDVIVKLADFVKQHGAKFGGPRGGTWRSKLSTKLGGVQTGGGAGDILVQRLLIEIALYMKERQLL